MSISSPVGRVRESVAAKTPSLRNKFRLWSRSVATAVGSPGAFLVAFLSIVIWGATGPLFRYSDTWQLVINTATTIVTFLMVFLIQNTQNRDTKAIQLKLDELLRGVTGARTSLIDLESLSDEELERLQVEFERLKRRARHAEERKRTVPGPTGLPREPGQQSPAAG